ncbi:MAG: 16S rRNA (guanine(966)-N(2))-methyltransferase RsmD [Negativicutes bacterium]|nr:16S rRNA (guanine(966)-N(2))-methyltransferase RsmD [Negativicutes bacterium]
MMRIITGSAKGLKLKTPRGNAVRPTGDRVKEAVFNILTGLIPDATVADLFAGTGNLGLEALSRGAEKAVFVDNSHSSMNLLKENAVRARLADRAEFLRTDALAAISRLQQDKRIFHLIFCDPPYNRGHVDAVLARIDAAEILAPDGVVVIEHSKHEPITAVLQKLQIRRSEHFGETTVSFLRAIRS